VLKYVFRKLVQDMCWLNFTTPQHKGGYIGPKDKLMTM